MTLVLRTTPSAPPGVGKAHKGFEHWGEVLGDDVMAAALIDRVLHHRHLVSIRGNTCRMCEHTELHRDLLQSDVEEATDQVQFALESA